MAFAQRDDDDVVESSRSPFPITPRSGRFDALSVCIGANNAKLWQIIALAMVR